MLARSSITWYAFSCLNLTLTVGPVSFVAPFTRYVPAVPLCPPALIVFMTVAMIELTVPLISLATCVAPASSVAVNVLSNVFLAIPSPISVPVIFHMYDRVDAEDDAFFCDDGSSSVPSCNTKFPAAPPASLNANPFVDDTFMSLYGVPALDSRFCMDEVAVYTVADMPPI